MKNNMRTFEVIYKGATNTQGSKIIITDLLRKEKRIISYDYNFNNILDGAINFLENELGIEIQFTSESIKGYLVHTKNFKTSIKNK